MIKLKALFLLLTYLFSCGPVILFHSHGLVVISYEKASSCEKAIYYGSGKDACKHTTHFATALEKCSLCDNHVISPHSPRSLINSTFATVISVCPPGDTQDYDLSTPCSFFNKGPPPVSAAVV